MTLELPYPPSVNEAFGNNWTGKGRGRFKTPKYVAWLKAADAHYTKQKAEKTVGTPIVGPYEIHMTFSEDRRRWNSDVDNRIKCVSDAMTRFGLIEDDSKCEKLTATWGPCEGVFIRAFRFVDTSPGVPSKTTSVLAGS